MGNQPWGNGQKTLLALKMNKNMKLNEETVNKLEEAFSIGADVSSACYYANISRQTYYNWEKDNPDLKEKFDRLKEKPILKAYKTISDDLDNKETAKWYLERKRKKEFSTRVETDITSNNKELSALTKEEEEVIDEAINNL